MRKPTRQTLSRVAALVFALGITVLIVLNRDRVEQFKALGYPGVFLVAMAGSATVIFPVPHLAFTFAMGSALSPWLVGLLAGLGDTAGELTGYMTGYALEEVADDFKLYRRVEHWMEVRGGLTLFILALIPNPVFDMASMVGGLAGFPVHRFLLVTWAGKTLKALGFAWAGYFGIRWLMTVFG
jgi:uncharacterized membrane protein YdjX (TVP38/TMEM64 family)